MPKLRVLIVDDEEHFRAPIRAVLASRGLEVMEAGTATQMDTLLSRFEIDILLLDVNLPGESGLQIANRLKQTRNIEIIMLSASGEVEHRVNGLISGADYYLPKPVDIRELLAVIECCKRQTYDESAAPASWQFDAAKWLLITPDGVEHSLSKSELNIVNALISMAGKTVTREQLYAAMGIPDYLPESRSLDIHITRIRRRFTTDSYVIPIITVRNVGYLFNDTVKIHR
ncbi:response regulator transcription factor [Methylophaga sp.]|uniref:response regulator transcription factor n=1 Tax=Methylophaga sp. TaxID=2024840 RepID=UPI00272883AD|nr:response regulator transcription factor [Methylophaga sp.]MDO8826707.1 response regulator transcription factor [Methylophaga sp.]